MDTSAPTTLLSIAKSSGRCPPSLIGEDRITENGEFEMLMLRALDRSSSEQGLNLGSELSATENFTSAMKMADTSHVMNGVPDAQTRSRALEQRRCIILAAIGSTAEVSPNNPTLKNILNAGLLVKVKSWLDDILASNVGGVDMLLHLLSNISPLPVTKEMVTSSRLGKAVAALEKHKICVGSMNESSIKSRVGQVKSRWSASVKALKNTPQSAATGKRPPEEDAPSAAKKVKRETPTTSLSNILKKVENVNNKAVSATESARTNVQERETKQRERLAAVGAKTDDTKGIISPEKDKRHIRWADDSGKALAIPHEKGADPPKEAETEKSPQDPRHGRPSWSDRKKKDLLHEKELLLHARKLDSFDEDKEDMLNAMAMMAVPWKPAIALPEDNVNPPIQVMSNEVATQNIRMSTTAAARYSSENEVPIGPKTLTDVEKALELSSGITSAPSIIPFFTPQEVAPNADSLLSTMTNAAPVFAPPPAVPNASSSEATIETVLTMGLPLFLVGSNIQALQTLAAAPGLLDTFRDANGVYDQPRLMNLVQTLTQNIAPAQASQPQHIGYGGSNPSQNSMNYYQPTPTPYAPPGQSFGAQNAYPAPTLASQQQSSQQSRGMGGGYRGDQNIGEANLHLSGYGPGTTDDDIIALFAPYVHVTEVVQKGTFSFVNTRDPDGAQRAREALSGALLCGTPVRINIATRKAKKPMSELNTMKPSSGGASTLPRNNMGQIAFDQVRDDRGNPSTKNLFIAGYGPGTTEQQLKELVAQYATVISVVVKGTFAFVNTTDRDQAVLARDALMGLQCNGGPLRINFAKESGRLGTSFDQTYGPASGASSYGRFR